MAAFLATQGAWAASSVPLQQPPPPAGAGAAAAPPRQQPGGKASALPAGVAAVAAAAAVGSAASRRSGKGGAGPCKAAGGRLVSLRSQSPLSVVSRGDEYDLAPLPLPLGEVQLDSAMMGYQQFVPRLYNLCKELGMSAGLIQPSIGFCADENQGYPTIIITKHFGAYPFNHGYIGGIMALDRHGPHAAHGEDMVIIHAPHVGYDPTTGRYGVYRRKQVQDPNKQVSTNCGKMAGVLAFYKQEYAQALDDIQVKVEAAEVLVSISNTLLEHGVAGTPDGLKLNFGQILADPTLKSPHTVLSASKVYVASLQFAEKVKNLLATASVPVDSLNIIKTLPGAEERRSWRSLSEPGLTELLEPAMFDFNRPPLDGERNRLERELLPHLPMILAGPWDAELTAALTCCQFEFDRSVHSVASEAAYKGKNLLLISGLNIDISPDATGEAYSFPSTMFLPWSAYIQLADGRRRILEQPDLIKALFSQSDKNPDAIDIETSITELFSRPRKRISFYDRNSGAEQAAKVL